MITENILAKVAQLTAVGTVAGTASLTQSTGIELSLVLWVVGGLLAVIATLLGAISYFIRDMRQLNARQHETLGTGQKSLSDRLSNLEGQHGAAFQARGCAYDPIRMQQAIDKAIDKNARCLTDETIEKIEELMRADKNDNQT